MKKDWKNLEGHKVRMDVGSSLKQALSDSMPAEVICFTTDNHIIFNGEEFANGGNVGYYVNKGIFELTDDSSEDVVAAVMDKTIFDGIRNAVKNGQYLYTDKGNVDVYLNIGSSLSLGTMVLESPEKRVTFALVGDNVKLSGVSLSKSARISALEKTIEELKNLLSLN